jgi:hypothetical protein
MLNQGNFAAKTELVLNEKVEGKDGKNEFQEIAKVALPVPTLEDFGIEAEQKTDEAGNAEVEDGLPVYVDDALNWLMSAILATVKAQSRNKFVKGVLKEGNKLAETFAELTAVGERSGEALKAKHDARRAFAAYLEAQNKQPVVVKLLSDLFGDTNSIAVAQDKFVDALKVHLPKFINGLNETDKVRYTRTIERIVEAIDGRGATLDNLM